jgi:hypothetical protein
LWKSVQIAAWRPGAEALRELRSEGFVRPRVDPQVNSVRACSACSGDYEHPEETAWTEMGEEDAGEADAENAEQPEVRE